MAGCADRPQRTRGVADLRGFRVRLLTSFVLSYRTQYKQLTIPAKRTIQRKISSFLTSGIQTTYLPLDKT